MAEDDVRGVLERSREGMEKAVHHLRNDLRRLRTGRANAALLDGIQIDYYGTATPLNQLANLTTPDPRLIVISPYDKSAIQAIEKAVLASDLGLTPASDGKVVRIPIPALTEERRKELVKHVRKVAEDHKLGVREARREAVARLKELETQGSLPADERHRSEKKIEEVTSEYVKKVDEIADQKEQEVLQV